MVSYDTGVISQKYSWYQYYTYHYTRNHLLLNGLASMMIGRALYISSCDNDISPLSNLHHIKILWRSAPHWWLLVIENYSSSPSPRKYHHDIGILTFHVGRARSEVLPHVMSVVLPLLSVQGNDASVTANCIPIIMDSHDRKLSLTLATALWKVISRLICIVAFHEEAATAFAMIFTFIPFKYVIHFNKRQNGEVTRAPLFSSAMNNSRMAAISLLLAFIIIAA